MCVSVYVSLLHDSASDGARTALAPCLETWLAPGLTLYYGLRQLNMFDMFDRRAALLAFVCHQFKYIRY